MGSQMKFCILFSWLGEITKCDFHTCQQQQVTWHYKASLSLSIPPPSSLPCSPLPPTVHYITSMRQHSVPGVATRPCAVVGGVFFVFSPIPIHLQKGNMPIQVCFMSVDPHQSPAPLFCPLNTKTVPFLGCLSHLAPTALPLLSFQSSASAPSPIHHHNFFFLD